jgi:hypothetical protein
VSHPLLTAARDLIQEDVGNRGLRTDPVRNLVTECPGDFEAACRSIAQTPGATVGVVTGFFIPHGQPPCGETDGPLGALFLARALTPLGIGVALLTDPFAYRALEIGQDAAGLELHALLGALRPGEGGVHIDWQGGPGAGMEFTHLIALERVGPSHTPASVRAQPGSTESDAEAFAREVPAEHHDRCHSMRGRDITEFMAPAHLLFENAGSAVTIGIGDGGNEIGMGKVPWDVVRRNIPRGDKVACRVATDHLIVCGVSNWGAYALGAGVRWLRGVKEHGDLFDVEREEYLLGVMVNYGPLVDGTSGLPAVAVDGLPFERYAEPLRRLGEMSRAT